MPPSTAPPILTIAEYRTNFPTSAENLYFPGNPQPAKPRFGPINLSPLPDDCVTICYNDTPPPHLVRRLIRALPKAPTVAIFPYPVTSLRGAAARDARPYRNKTGDEQFCFPLSEFITWPLGNRKLRLGLFESLLKADGVTSKRDRRHYWVAGLMIRSQGVGKDLIIFDGSAEKIIAVREEDGVKVVMSDLSRGQTEIKRFLKEYHRTTVQETWWGGRRADMGLGDEEGDMNLEASLRFIELFSEQVEANAGVATPEMLSAWGMRRKQWR